MLMRADAPAEGLAVELQRGSAPAIRAISDADGRIPLPGLAHGSYAVRGALATNDLEVSEDTPEIIRLKVP